MALAALTPLLILRQMSSAELTRSRDWWLRGLLAGATVWLVWAEPIFAPIAAWFLCRWRTQAELGPLAAWGSVVACWFAVRSVPPELLDWVPLAWLAWALVTAALLVWQARTRPPHVGINPAGTFGQRTFAAAYLALCLPFAPWGLWPAIGLGLWITGPSWGALLALGAGLPLLFGWMYAVPLWWLLGALAGLLWAGRHDLARRWLDLSPRGSSLDSLWSRWHALRLMWRHRGESLPWGQGPDSTWRILLRLEGAYKSGTEPRLTRGDCHCDPVQLVWEYGVAGVAVILIACWRIGSGLTWGDPWSAAAVIAGGLSLTSLPLRVPPVALVSLVIFARVAP